MKAYSIKSKFLALIFSFMLHNQVSAQGRFPFVATESGELVDGFRFYDVLFQGQGVDRSEVMVVGAKGVVFPADLKFSLPLLKAFYEKLAEANQEGAEKSEGKDIGEELVRLITPSNTYQLMIYPEVEAGKAGEAAEYLRLSREQVNAITAEWSKKASEQKKGEANGHREKVYTIMYGDVIREFHLVVDEKAEKLISMSMAGAFQVAFGPLPAPPDNGDMLPAPADDDEK